ncbi:hypothetical protein [Tenacibaculum retecalamus]|uniref:hypothetical protein n=1 Tax=Tenacibaculum retecalamus TaxID=3018315 RepID=UPI0023D96F8B|nr:hypothetical protein [Tenacibaculum retecalamus]WBX72006.1 hypothetical protein PG912_04340 [Tenacibaculum retecalamus]
MFDKNKNVKVGRDININIEKNNIEKYEKKELLIKKTDANLILKKITNQKLKTTLNYLISALIIFILIYFLVPFLLNKYENEENVILDFVNRTIQDKNTGLTLSILASLITIITPLSNLWKSNDIEKKQYETLKLINIILKERNYLNK